MGHCWFSGHDDRPAYFFKASPSATFSDRHDEPILRLLVISLVLA
jgi:hypothetical protein